jgi:leucyl-tRNA synthetase
MDTFVDSSWYFYRFADPHNDAQAFDPAKVKYWLPVDFYCGGIEHAILHLLYSRFFTKVLRDLGIVNSDEPFLRLRNQGMILGGNNEKMSKSRGNVADPDDLVAAYGADTVRAYLMFLGPWDQGAPWSSQGIEGVSRFLNRVWNTVMNEAAAGAPAAADGAARELRRAVHHAIREVTEDLEEFSFNTALAELMTLQGALNRAKDAGLMGSAGWDEAVETLLLLLAPIAPHITEELWHLTGHTESIHLQSWPVHDESALTLQTVKMAVQVSGRVRGQIEVAADADQAAILAAARAEPNVARYLTDASVVREIVVPGRLVNFVVRPA